MTQQQWDEAAGHMQGHITFPATRDQVVAACNNMSDVSAEVKADVEANLSEGTYNSADDLHVALVK